MNSDAGDNQKDTPGVKSTSASVRFAEVEAEGDNDVSLEQTLNLANVDINKLTNKKKQYLQDAIIDKNGAYTYLDDPVEYKKARKRLQNRESAVRSRHRKKTYQETLEQQIEKLTQENEALKNSNR